MKKINLLILPLIALSMVGCNRTANSSISSNDPISEKASETSSSAPKESSSSAPKESSSSAPKESATSSSSSSSTVDVYSLGWSRDVTDKMLKYLNNTVLPYVNLGKSSYVEASWTVSYDNYGALEIAGTAEWDSTATPAVLTAAYTGWTITKNDTGGFKATDSTGKVHVEIGPKSTSSYSPDETLTIKATCDEDYDKTVATAWDADVTQVFTDNFGAVAPFVYLGTKFPTAEFNSYYNKVTVTGGKWNSQVLTDAVTTLNAAGYDVSKSGNVVTATGKISADSSDTFTITISKTGYSAEKITMEVVLTEAWDPTAQTAWPTTVSTEIATDMDGHDIPYLYLGTKNPSVYYYTSYTELDIRGVDDNITDEKLQEIFTLSETAFADWTKVTDARTSSDTKQIIYSKKFDDNCTIKVIIKESYSYGVVMECYLLQGITVPEGVEAWTDATKTLMTSKFGYVLPYAYLNTTTELASWDEDTSTMTITGGAWVNSQGILVGEVYSAIKNSDGNAVWTVGDADSSGVVKIEGTIDGTRYKITVQDNNGNVEMTIVYIPKYNPDAYSEWDDGVKNQFNTYFDGHILPYVYLRSNNCSTYYSSYSNYLQITGGEWDEAMITAMKAAYKEEDGWTVVSDVAATTGNAGSYRVKKTFEDGCTFEVLLNRYSSYTTKAEMLIWLTQGYVEGENQPTEWSSAASGEISKCSGLDLPYVYLAAKAPAVSYSSGGGYYYYSGYVSFVGGTWDKRILTGAMTSLTNGGYTMYETEGNYGKMLIGYKENTASNVFISVYVTQNSDGKACMTAYVSPLQTISKTGTWDEATDTAIKNYTEADNNMTYINLGSTITFTDDSDHGTLTGNEKLTHQRAFVIYEQLAADGWDVSMKLSGSDFQVNATKSLGTNKGSVQLKIDNWSVAKAYVYYYPAFIAPEGVTDWEDSVKSVIESNLGSGHTLPYFYIGADHPSATYSSYYQKVTIRGTTWDDRIYDNAIAAFEADVDENGKSYWSYVYDYSSSDYTALLATRAFDDGTHMTVKVYKYNDYASSYPCVDVTCR